MRIAHRPSAVTALLGLTAMILGIVSLACAPGSLAAAAGAARPSAASPGISSSPAPSQTGTTSPSPSPKPSPSASPTPSATQSQQPPHRPPGTTVRGPKMWDPKHNSKFARPSTVTVSQTASLVNEMVHVSWTGFTPSSDILYDPTFTDYPVMVAECDTAHPVSWKQCYGANNGGVQGAFGPFGPMNTAYATTSPNGTGELDIQILTTVESQFLGCSVHHSCSLVIVPSQGGNTLSSPAHCRDHSIDPQGTDLGQFAFSSQTGQCSWQDRIVVPLAFAPSPSSCAIKNASFAAIGSPMLLRAMDQWRAGLCAASTPLAITFNAAITEPEALADLPNGLGDIALTTRPSATNLTTNKTYTYAPVAISAVAIAYWVDSPRTGKPVTSLRLDPRLVAKLVTQSYNFENEGCGHGKPPPKIGCDRAVDGNPFSLFDDPEFNRLNPTIKAPSGTGAAFQVPTVESGHSDMTWEITRWIAANNGAAGFMSGRFDQWGMHLNTDYLGLKYPTDSFTGQDPYPVIAHKYSPVFPLSLVASYQAQNWDPGTDWEKDQVGNFPRDPIEIPGERALFAILDEGDAAAFRFPVAKILNHSGRYVAPTAASMAAAMPSLVATGNNHVTQTVDYNKQAAGAYPLTMVIYAMVPTSGVKQAKANAIARFLEYVATTGQKPGVLPGNLAPGYLPLPASMRAETLKAAILVRAQSGKSANLKSGLSPSIGSLTSPSSLPSLPAARFGPGVRVVALKRHTTASVMRYALPALVIAGGATTLGGTSALMIGSQAALVERVRRLRRLRLVWRKRQ